MDYKKAIECLQNMAEDTCIYEEYSNSEDYINASKLAIKALNDLASLEGLDGKSLCCICKYFDKDLTDLPLYLMAN